MPFVTSHVWNEWDEAEIITTYLYLSPYFQPQLPPLTENEWDDVADRMEAFYEFLGFPGLDKDSKRRGMTGGIHSHPSLDRGIESFPNVRIAIAGTFISSQYKELGFHTYYSPRKLLRMKVIRCPGTRKFQVMWRMYSTNHFVFWEDCSPFDIPGHELIRKAIEQERLRRAQWDHFMNEVENSSDPPYYPGVNDFSRPDLFVDDSHEIRVTKTYPSESNSKIALCGLVSASSNHDPGEYVMYRRDRVLYVKVENHPAIKGRQLFSYVFFQDQESYIRSGESVNIMEDICSAIVEEQTTTVSLAVVPEHSHADFELANTFIAKKMGLMSVDSEASHINLHDSPRSDVVKYIFKYIHKGVNPETVSCLENPENLVRVRYERGDESQMMQEKKARKSGH